MTPPPGYYSSRLRRITKFVVGALIVVIALPVISLLTQGAIQPWVFWASILPVMALACWLDIFQFYVRYKLPTEASVNTQVFKHVESGKEILVKDALRQLDSDRQIKMWVTYVLEVDRNKKDVSPWLMPHEEFSRNYRPAIDAVADEEANRRKTSIWTLGGLFFLSIVWLSYLASASGIFSNASVPLSYPTVSSSSAAGAHLHNREVSSLI